MKKFLNRHSHVKSYGFILLIAIDRQPFSVFCSDWHFTLSDGILKTNGLASELSLFWLRRYMLPWCLPPWDFSFLSRILDSNQLLCWISAMSLPRYCVLYCCRYYGACTNSLSCAISAPMSIIRRKICVEEALCTLHGAFSSCSRSALRSLLLIILPTACLTC